VTIHNGRVLAADIASGTALFDGADEVHVELPPGVGIGTADASVRAGIARAESTRPA
jgi:hypothetical protein